MCRDGSSPRLRLVICILWADLQVGGNHQGWHSLLCTALLAFFVLFWQDWLAGSHGKASQTCLLSCLQMCNACAHFLTVCAGCAGVCRQEFAAVQDILQSLLQPRLLACVASLFANSSSPATFQAKLDLLMQHPGAFGQQDSPSQHQHNQHLKAQVHLALDALQEAMPSMPLDHIAPACKQIVRWALSTTGEELMVALLAPAEASAAAAAMDGSAHGQDESAWNAAGLELQQSVLQGCLVALLVCWTLLQDMQQQQLELLAAVNTLGEFAVPDFF